MKKILLLGSVALLSGCRFWLDPGVAVKHEEPNFIYMPDMVYTKAVKAQSPGSMRTPVAGTIFREKTLGRIPENPEEAGRVLKNPLRMTKANLERGQHIFNIYCIACHGPYGEGNGGVVPRYPQPPSLQSDKVMGYINHDQQGRIYHIISKGQNLMPSYASQIDPMDRWKVVMYVKALQRAKHPTAEDLKAAENN